MASGVKINNAAKQATGNQGSFKVSISVVQPYGERPTQRAHGLRRLSARAAQNEVGDALTRILRAGQGFNGIPTPPSSGGIVTTAITNPRLAAGPGVNRIEQREHNRRGGRNGVEDAAAAPR